MGLGYTPEHKINLQAKDPINFEDWQLETIFTCDITGQDCFVNNIPTKSRIQTKTFNFFILNLSERIYQTFSCPMNFPNSSYSWCATGENKLVSFKFLISFILK